MTETVPKMGDLPAVADLFCARLDDPRPLRSNRNYTLAILVILVSAALVGSSGLFSKVPEAHDIFPAQSAYEMYHLHSWIVPYFNGIPRLHKPPLGYWLTGAVGWLTGARGEFMVWHARVGSIICGIGFVGGTVFIAAMLYGRLAALVSGTFLTASLGYFNIAVSARPDMMYGFLYIWQLAAILAACRAEDRSRSQWIWAHSMWAFAALATLAKGPQMPLLLLIAMSAWFLARRVPFGRAWRILRPGTGFVLFALIAGPWFLYIAHLLRTGVLPVSVELGTDEFTGSDLGVNWKAPLGVSFYNYYPYHLVRMLFPWIILLPGLFMIPFTSGPMRTSTRLLGWIILTALIMFGFGATRRQHYLMPVLPAGVIMAVASLGWFDWSRVKSRDPWPSMIGIYTVLALGGVVWANYHEYVHDGLLIDWTDVAASLGILAVATTYFLVRRRFGGAWSVSCRVGALLLPLLFVPFFAAIGTHPAYLSDRDLHDLEFVYETANLAGEDDVIFTYSVHIEPLIYVRRTPILETLTLEALTEGLSRSTSDHVLVVTQEEYAPNIPESWNPRVLFTQRRRLGGNLFLLLIIDPADVRKALR